MTRLASASGKRGSRTVMASPASQHLWSSETKVSPGARARATSWGMAKEYDLLVASQGTKVWADGDLVDFDDATVHVLSNSNQRGSTVFDVMRVVNTAADGPAVFGLREHVARFVRSMGIMGMQWDGSIGALERAIAQTVAANEGSSVVKLVATWSEVGTASVPANLTPRIWVAALDPAATSDGAPKASPLKLKVADGPKIPDEVLPVGLKVGAIYAQGIREIMAARAAGYDDVVFRDTDGALAEGSTKSLIVVKNGKLLLPGLNQVLDGISRRAVLELAQHAGITSEIRHVYWDEVTDADELFVSSTNTVVLSVVQVDDASFAVGPVTTQLSDAAQSLLAGTHDLSRRWLTPLSRFG